MKRRSNILLLFVCLLLGSACSNHAFYTEESFAEDSPFKMKMDGEFAAVCESARRALLGQGYLIEHISGEQIKARKAAKREDNPNTFIEMNLVCLPETIGSTLFATGLLSTYELKKSSSSASVGVSALGSISLPIGQSADSLVKISEETIDDKDFYRRFFNAVGNILNGMQIDKVPSDITVEPVTTEPAPEDVEPVPVAQPAPLQTAPPSMSESAPVEPAAPGPSPGETAPMTETEPDPANATEKITPEEFPDHPGDPF
ncbi:MAG: DUF2242 domain-containing protein [Gammaproteobacteria bacterium]|nr:DUF2242 domain-containing protein [Gammaproteobacteria bacterium]MCB1850790.1 DUF2242 domain-containing protein [Gammaproteobacteria bacterium]